MPHSARREFAVVALTSISMNDIKADSFVKLRMSTKPVILFLKSKMGSDCTILYT